MRRRIRNNGRFLTATALNEQPRDALVVVVVLFAAIFVLRFVATTSADAVTFLYVLPVALAALALGERAGLAAGGVALALSILWAQVEAIGITPLGYLVRATIFLLTGALVGRFAKRLRVLEAETARHFDLSRDLICIAGEDGFFKNVNPAFERVLGYTREELLSRPYAEFVHPEDVEKTEVEAGAIPGGGSTLQFRNRYIAKDGSIRWLEWMSTPLAEERLIYAVARDVTERRALEEELERLSQHDSLTGLYNRRRFEEELEAQLAYTRRYGSGGALLLLDLDNFKQINDELGHAAGDQALRRVGDVLRANLRASDTVGRAAGPVVARLGGDEFVALLPEAGAEGARTAAERLVSAVCAAEIGVDGATVRLAASVGIALFDEQGCPPAATLLEVADRAMYEAKAGGGSCASLAVLHG